MALYKQWNVQRLRIGSYKEYNAPNNYVIPNGHDHVVVAIQERVDKREKPKHCDNPIVKAHEDCAILLTFAMP
jgi:hypothetical protein